jgi:hypothetical protein
VNYPSDVEVWKPIPGYEGIYEASNQGRIRTAEGKTTYTERHGVRSWQQRVLKQKWRNRKSSGKADARVCLWKDGEEKTFLVARLVAMSFLPPPYDKLTVNHIDGDTTNNNISNLEWVTVAENNRLGFQGGLFKSVQKAVILTDANGYESYFASMADASRYLNHNVGYVSYAIARGNYCYDEYGTKYWARLVEDGDAEA